jgi:hypothetical protein
MVKHAKKPQKHRGRSKFRKTEATRLVRAALDAGLLVHRIEIDPASGKVSLFPGKADDLSGKPLGRGVPTAA